ncbi:GIY-YIG nuclease family protein [Alkaliphilus hydrothermalis]|uniref:Excinuclease ABC subunit C n=1 Tax=Alkaliphilus hydrothermalis TaxID=1482730 RepID=A0ABS2NTE6_9FIRM|nr:GIY-YIG nuclease family protein [Alkaliphilus hydrothermalis]MBM7616230.1 excinuclease ABC subunit C [Alkaliphilus hydrothermalis]
MRKVPYDLVEKINAIPVAPGVYQMKDFQGNIIYIGKSKNLKSRVKSYFNREHDWNKIKRMVFHIHDIDYIVTDTHLEAQMLECSLIKSLKPIYNAQFKNEQKYKYIKVEGYNPCKILSMVDEREEANCFGPYRSKNILLNIINFFHHIYPITKCAAAYEFNYNVLPKAITKDFFVQNRECLVEILSKKEILQLFILVIEEKMKIAAKEEQYEIASIYRDIIPNMKYLFTSKSEGDHSHLINRRILLGEKILEGYKIFYISNDRIIHKKKYKRLSSKFIEGFLNEGRRLEESAYDIKSEKSQLDYRAIISGELKNVDCKHMTVIDDQFDSLLFIRNLKGLGRNSLEEK